MRGESLIFPVGASLLAMEVNDDAAYQAEHRVLKTIASKLAPTGVERLRTDVRGLHHGVELLRIATLLAGSIG
ncbi:hypothetical protein EJA72_29730 [Pseudomonas sp. PB120]|nr:hypothetical protein [Pseudomonas sp. PB120]